MRVLEGWNRTRPGIFLYHPSRRQTPMPLQVFLKFSRNGAGAPWWPIASHETAAKMIGRTPVNTRLRRGSHAARPQQQKTAAIAQERQSSTSAAAAR